MSNINFKDIKVLSGSLDIKYNDGKTLSEILSQLQTGEQMKATVAKTMLSGEMVLMTSFGKMITENKLNLVRGDIINIELLEIGEIIKGNILTVNNQETGKPSQIFLELLNTAQLRPAENQKLTVSSTHNTDKLSVDTRNINNIPKEISGSISYLNLSKIDKSSNIFRIINILIPQVESNQRSVQNNIVGNKIDPAGEIKIDSGKIPTNFNNSGVRTESSGDTVKQSVNIGYIGDKQIPIKTRSENSRSTLGLSEKTLSPNLLATGGAAENNKQSNIPNIPISLNIVSDKGSEPSVFSFQGIVSGNEKDNRQLIKTDFGIITTENTNLRIGQRLTLSLTSLNNKAVNNDFIKSIADFLFKINNLPTLRDFSFTACNLSSKNSETTSELRENIPDRRTSSLDFSAENPSKKSVGSDRLNNIVKELKNNDEIKKIINEYHHIKTLLPTGIKIVQPDLHWQSFFVPIYNGYKVEEREIKIKKTKEEFLRFLLNINFSENSMQLDGLIQFETGSKKPKSFDMILRSKNTVDADFRKTVNEIFVVNQEITGIRGTFSVERTDDFESV